MPLQVTLRSSVPVVEHYLDSESMPRTTISRRRAQESLRNLHTVLETVYSAYAVDPNVVEEIEDCLDILHTFVSTR